MTTPALVKSADLKRMGAFVKANPGLRVEVEKNGILIRVAPDIPETHRSSKVELSDDFAL